MKKGTTINLKGDAVRGFMFAMFQERIATLEMEKTELFDECVRQKKEPFKPKPKMGPCATWSTATTTICAGWIKLQQLSRSYSGSKKHGPESLNLR